MHHPTRRPGDRLLENELHYPGTFEPLAVIDADKQLYYYHNDINGLPQELTCPEGRIVWSARYDALGRLQGLRVDEVAQPLRLQGQYWDQEIGLCYNRYRYFDPHICSFISQDPIGLAGGENVYAYAPNVWGWVDPLGLCAKDQKLLPAPKESNPLMPNTPLESYPVPKGGMEVEMAMSPGQTNPGGWATRNHIPNADFVRNDLAVIPDFKPQVSGVQKWLIPEGVQIQEGIVGPQIQSSVIHPGGANQVQILNYSDRSKLIPLGPVRPIH
jgi:RHS repeat-associated protein